MPPPTPHHRLLSLAILSAAAPPAVASTSGPDLATIDARIETAHARVERWYERIERWYERIERASARVERLEARLERSGGLVRRCAAPPEPPVGGAVVPVRPSLARAQATLKDPWARKVQAELDTWNAYLAELTRARERALRRPTEEERTDGSSTRGGAAGLLTYEGWAGAFLGRLGAPVCADNLLIVVTWETAESTSATFNPLATTRDMPGATDMNDVGVKHFVSLDQGLDASRDTLLLGAESYGYRAIVAGLERARRPIRRRGRSTRRHGAAGASAARTA